MTIMVGFDNESNTIFPSKIYIFKSRSRIQMKRNRHEQSSVFDPDIQALARYRVLTRRSMTSSGFLTSRCPSNQIPLNNLHLPTFRLRKLSLCRTSAPLEFGAGKKLSTRRFHCFLEGFWTCFVVSGKRTLVRSVACDVWLGYLNN